MDVNRFGKLWTGFTEEIYVYKNNDLFTLYNVENILSRSLSSKNTLKTHISSEELITITLLVNSGFKNIYVFFIISV